MKECDVCAQVKNDTTLTYVITIQDKRKDISICKSCVNIVCETQVGQWFPLQTTDEKVRLPNAFYTKL
jgi:hypothetical protein